MTVLIENSARCECPPCDEHALIVWYENPRFPLLGEPELFAKRVFVPNVYSGGIDQAAISVRFLRAAGVDCSLDGNEVTFDSVLWEPNAIAGKIRAIGVQTDFGLIDEPFPYVWEMGNSPRDTEDETVPSLIEDSESAGRAAAGDTVPGVFEPQPTRGDHPARTHRGAGEDTIGPAGSFR